MGEKIDALREKQDKTLHEKMLLKAADILGHDFNWGGREGSSKENEAYCLLETLVEKDDYPDLDTTPEEAPK